MINELRDYPQAKHDDMVDAVAHLPQPRNRRWLAACCRVLNWLATVLSLTAVPYVVGYVGMRLIRFMVAPPTLTTQAEWIFAVWCLGFVSLAALVIGIMGAYVLIDTTRKM